jgi:acyl carrier protein
LGFLTDIISFFEFCFSDREKPEQESAESRGKRIMEDMGEFEYSEEGFCYGNDLYRWNDIREINAYKVDLFTVDDVRMEMRFQEYVLTLSEDTPGWHQFQIRLKQAFPQIDADWEYKIWKPAFATNYTTLFKRSANEVERSENRDMSNSEKEPGKRWVGPARNIEYSFEELLSFVRDQSGAQDVALSRQTLIEDDLGVTGEDAYELIVDIGKKYQVDLSDFDFRKYFNDEPNIFSMDRKVAPFTVGHLEKAILAGRLNEEVIHSNQ